MGKTKIEYVTDVWNPLTGCDPVSEGCENCYARRMAYRLKGRCGYPADNPFRVTLHPQRLDQPLRQRKPRRIFVCSMGDLFHPDVDESYIDQIFGVMAAAQNHCFILLTKRADRMFEYMTAENRRNEIARWKRTDGICRAQAVSDGFEDSIPWPLPNVIGMVTAENQEMADLRIPYLLNTPFITRGVSVEPMLGPVNLSHYLVPKNIRKEREDGSISLRLRPSIKWVIAGGETGTDARPIHPDWVCALQRQCYLTCTKFFFKSWGEWKQVKLTEPLDVRNKSTGNFETLLIGTDVFKRVGKKATGRLLDGRTWDEYPRMDVY